MNSRRVLIRDLATELACVQKLVNQGLGRAERRWKRLVQEERVRRMFELTVLKV